ALERAHVIDEAAEQIMTVARAGRGFGMILHREHRPVVERQSAIRTVEQRHVGFYGVSRQRCAVAGGSPGPLDRNTPSGLSARMSSAEVLAGTTVTLQAWPASWRRILRLMP